MVKKKYSKENLSIQPDGSGLNITASHVPVEDRLYNIKKKYD